MCGFENSNQSSLLAMATTASDFETALRHQRMFAASHGIILSLPDSAITATRSYNANHGPQYVKLGAEKVSSASHAWCCISPLANDYLTIDLDTSHVVTGIEIAGRGTDNTNQIITKFNVKTSENGIHWEDQGVFLGPHEESTPVKRKLRRAVVASFVRITPLEFKVHPSMRVDILVYETH